MRKLLIWLGLALALLAPSATAQTYSYEEYDVFGRLVHLEDQTGLFIPVQPSRLRYTYDAADNRTHVKQGTSSPVPGDDLFFFQRTYWDTGSAWEGSMDVLYNDDDADLPFDTKTIASIATLMPGHPLYGKLSIATDSKSIWLDDTVGIGSYYGFDYTMQDSDGNPGTAHVMVYRYPDYNCGSSPC